MAMTDAGARANGDLRARADCARTQKPSEPRPVCDLASRHWVGASGRGIYGPACTGSADRRDLGSYVAEAQAAMVREVTLPRTYSPGWGGQFEYLERAKAPLANAVPITLAVIFLLLFLNLCRLTKALIVRLSLPFALVGGVWLIWWMGFSTSVAVAIGFIALAGVAAETVVIVLIYLAHTLAERWAEVARAGRAFTPAHLDTAIMVGAVKRVQPKMMTAVAITAGLMPILWAHGTRSEMMVVIPAAFALIKGYRLQEESVSKTSVGAAKV